MRWNVRQLSLVSATLWGLCGSGIVGAQEAAPPETKKPELAQVEAAPQTIELEVIAQPAAPGAPAGQQPVRVRLVAPPGGVPQVVPIFPAEGQTELKTRYLRLANPAADAGAGVVAETYTVAIGDYWLGVQLGELTDLVKSHLAVEHGLVVNSVLPDSPAVKAGLKTYDIILAVNEKPTKEATDLIEAVNTAKETELSLTIIRAGKKETVKATPAKRPDPPAQGVYQGVVVDGETQWSKLHEALKNLNVAPGQPPVHVWAFGQPMAVPPGVAAVPGQQVQGRIAFAGSLPNNCQIQINKQGDAPAKVVITQGDKKYEATEDKLDSLPEDLREAVRSMLGRRVTVQMGTAVPPGFAPMPVPATPVAPPGAGAIYVNPNGPVAVPLPPHVTARLPNVVIGSTAGNEEVTKKLDSILQRLDKLQTELESMKKK